MLSPPASSIDVASQVGYASCPMAERPLARLGRALAASASPTSICNKLCFYPRGRAIVDAATIWHAKASRTWRVSQQLWSVMETFLLQFEDEADKALKPAALEAVAKKLCLLAEEFPECLESYLHEVFEDPLESSLSKMLLYGVEVFGCYIKPLMDGTLSHAAWTDGDIQGYRVVSAYLTAAKDLCGSTGWLKFGNAATWERLEAFASARAILDLLKNLKAEAAKVDAMPGHASAFMKMVTDAFCPSERVADLFGGDAFVEQLAAFKASCPLVGSTMMDKVRATFKPRMDKLFGPLLEQIAAPIWSGSIIGEDSMSQLRKCSSHGGHRGGGPPSGAKLSCRAVRKMTILANSTSRSCSLGGGG